MDGYTKAFTEKNLNVNTEEKKKFLWLKTRGTGLDKPIIIIQVGRGGNKNSRVLQIFCKKKLCF
jgi:hypothetical protein